MSIFKNITFSFHAGLAQFFLFAGPKEKPTEIFNVTPSVEEGIIASYLTKPGILKAPDGSEFLLELTLLPFFREAKQKLLDEGQAKVTAANSIALPPEGSEDAMLLSQLTQADRDLLAIIHKARTAGQHVTMRYPPFKAEVRFGPVPQKPKKPKATPAQEAATHAEDVLSATIAFAPPSDDAYDAGPSGKCFNDEVPQQQIASNRVPVVIVYLQGDENCKVVTRSDWDSWIAASTSQEADWREKGIRCFCFVHNIPYDTVTEVDFDQTYSKDELQMLADLD